MQNKILFIESNTTGTGMLAVKKAVSLDLAPIFFTNNPERYAGLTETGCSIRVCDTNDRDDLLRVIEETIPRDQLAGITTTSDFYVETVAWFTSHFDLPGNRQDAIQKARNKALTRQTLAAAGVRQPRFAVCRSVQEAEVVLNTMGLPYVVKPVDDSGSNNVVLCQTVSQVKEQVEKILAVTTNVRGQRTAGAVLLEEYVDAPEYSVEMYTREGQSTCIGITEKSLSGFPYFVESRHLFPAPLAPAQAAAMEEAVHQALQALGIQNGFTHTEMKWTSEGASIIEINPRLAGGMIPELIRLTTGIDLLEVQILGAVGRLHPFEVRPNGVAGIQSVLAGQAGMLRQINGVDAAGQVAGVQSVNITVKPGTFVQPPQNAYQRLGNVIAHRATAEETANILQKALHCMEIELEPAFQQTEDKGVCS